MSAMAYLTHSGIIAHLFNKIFNYVVANKCGYVFPDNVDVHLPDGNLFRPDLTVVTAENKKILNWKGAIRGVPDMVVEVLSRSTKNNDLTIKKDIYEANGVKEYWIVKAFRFIFCATGNFNLTANILKLTMTNLNFLTTKKKNLINLKLKFQFSTIYL